MDTNKQNVMIPDICIAFAICLLNIRYIRNPAVVNTIVNPHIADSTFSLLSSLTYKFIKALYRDKDMIIINTVCQEKKVFTRPYCSSDSTLVKIGVVIIVTPRCRKLQIVNQNPAFIGSDISEYLFCKLFNFCFI